MATEEFRFSSSSTDPKSSMTNTERPAGNEQWIHGHILGVELPVIDLFRAQTFYENVFNWKFTRYGESSVVHFNSGSVPGIILQVEEHNHYTLAFDHAQGIMTSNSGKSATARSVGFTIHVDDMGRTLSEVTKAGGRVWLHAREFHDDDPGRDGHFAYIRDTEDNVVGLRSIAGSGSSEQRTESGNDQVDV